MTPKQSTVRPSSRRSGSLGKTGCGTTRKPGGIDAERGERLTAVLAVHDDTVEARKQPAPQLGLARRPPRQQVVRREHRRDARPEEVHVELRRRQPLEVEHVRRPAQQRSQPERVLERA